MTGYRLGGQPGATHEMGTMLRSQSKTTTVVLVVLLGLGLAGCASDGDASSDAAPVHSPAATPAPTSEPEVAEEVPEPFSLDGEWVQLNSNAAGTYQVATVRGDAIEVFWIGDGGNSRSLYWAGNAATPADADDELSWESANSRAKTNGEMLASAADSKTFTFASGELSYEVTAFGETTTVRLGRG